MIKPINSERLLIDSLAVRDRDFILELVNTAGWLRFIGDRHVHTGDDASKYIQKIIDAPNISYQVVRLKNDDVPVGIISFIKRDYLAHYDIGFAMLPRFQGLGYAFEAARALLLEVLHFPENDIILATANPQNSNSIALLQKLGLGFDKKIKVAEEILQLYSGSRQALQDLHGQQ